MAVAGDSNDVAMAVTTSRLSNGIMRPSLQTSRFHPIDQGWSLGELATTRNTSDVAARRLSGHEAGTRLGADQMRPFFPINEPRIARVMS
jgi:hypothetical protein